ncbi:MAG: DUF1731 domain-containing protein [Flavobacteriia bacterium]|nr:DUF1731 domain-containing protein [Flavobacteriia bacterium]
MVAIGCLGSMWMIWPANLPTSPKIQSRGFAFHYPTLEAAFAQLLQPSA